jgi:hypothetical protein
MSPSVIQIDLAESTADLLDAAIRTAMDEMSRDGWVLDSIRPRPVEGVTSTTVTFRRND